MKPVDSARNEPALLEQLLLEKYEPVAIIGMGVRLPGGNHTPDEFLEFLRGGGDGIVDIPSDRWDNRLFYDREGGKGTIRTNQGGYLSDLKGFDPQFFNISPKEAAYIDPQQRLVLETAWEALEHAQVDPNANGARDGGVFVGVSSIDYSLEVDRLAAQEYDGYIGTGTAHSAVAGRVSYFLGWRGPSVAVDTACSSSLVALHMAIQALRRRECGVALCAGVNAIHHPRNLIVFSQANMLSPDGRCKTFDDGADGYGRSEGCVTVVLKRVSDAVRDRDRIIALLRGSSVNQDGESGGLTVPNGVAQELVMRRAIKNGALRPADVQLVEAHGTGTSLGDPIEVSAINAVFRESHAPDRPVRISSVKANIGHAEAAAGMIGVAKAALQLQAAEIFPHVGIKTPSRHIPWKDYVVEVPTAGAAWDAPVRRCLVNSFGFAGTIASVVLEQAPDAVGPKGAAATNGELPAILTLSAKSAKSLASQAHRLHEWLVAHPATDLPSLAFASNRRAHLPHRLALALDADHSGQLLAWLETQARKDRDEQNAAAEPRLALLFTGQGSQYVGMGHELYARIKHIRKSIDLCDELFRQPLGCSIRDIMFGAVPDAEELIRQTRYTQPALFTLEYAVASYYLSLGLKPDCLIGHSIGEVTAACVAGLMSLPDAVRLVAVRGRLMQSVTTSGGMLAVRLGEQQLQEHLAEYPALDFAAINAPDQCVVTGDLAEIEALHQALGRAGIDSEPLEVSHAFHSRQMRPVYDRFRSELSGIEFREPAITLISNLTGEVARFAEIGNIDYWARQICEPVRFAACIRTLARRGRHLCLEVGPSGVLCGLGKRTAPDNLWLYSAHPLKPLRETLGTALAECYRHKLDIDWRAYHEGQRYAWVDLPRYPFDRRPCWLPVSQPALSRSARGTGEFSLLGEMIQSDGGQVVFRREISADDPAYLAHHRFGERVVFPGAGYVETLIAAQLALFGEHAAEIGEIAIHEPLYLDAAAVEYATLCDPRPDGGYSARIVSRLGGGDHLIERLHVTAQLHPGPSEFDGAPDLRDAPAAESPVVRSGDDLYPEFESVGLQYGDAFQRIRRVRSYADRMAIAELESGAPDGTLLGAPLLDCAMQSLGALLGLGKAYLPVKFGSVRFCKRPRGAVVSTARLQKRDGEQVVADLLLMDGERPVCVVRGLVLHAVEPQTGQGKQLFHEPIWKKRSLLNQSAGAASVLFFSPPDGLPPGLAAAAASEAVRLIPWSDGAEAVQQLQRHQEIRHLVYHWRPDGGSWESHYDTLLKLIATLDEGSIANELRIWLVTELGQCIDGSADAAASLALDPRSATLWGFGHTLLNEYPRWRATLVDLPDTGADPQAWQRLMKEIVADAGEYQIGYRGADRYVRRLIARDPTLPGAGGDFELQVSEFGAFEHIRPVAVEVRSPGPDEVQVAVRAAGLNFKDVLNALGLLKAHAEEHGIAYQPLPLGFEASGEIVGAGAESGFRVGEEVMLSHLGCFRSRVTVPALAVVRKPPNLTHAQAAAVPTAYITAYYALHRLAGMRPGDRVLIHAAAGGVGQAAVQLARRVGAEVFATASPHKWPLLRSQGVKHLMSSRSTDFAAEVMAATGGTGVDIVLNSLNREFIPAGLDCLGANGRFVELGKIGIWDTARVRDYRPDVAYHNFDLSELPESELLRVNGEILAEAGELLARGEVQPLPVSTYGLGEVDEAFSVLSRGANTGKLVITLSEAPKAAPDVRVVADRTYLITGGFGALGRALTGKLAALGALHIALCGRRAPSPGSLEELRSTLPAGVTLYPVAADVADPDAVTALFRELAEHAPPVGGVFHTAGVLADAPLRDQDMPRMERVFAPKVAGTDNLLAALPDASAFFVGFSSVASLMGSAGQGNYAAANAYIDHRLRCEVERGRHCLSVNWGPWSEIGMAAGLTESMLRGITERGILFLSPKVALRSLFRRLAHPGPQSMIGEVDWARYISSLPFDVPLYSLLSRGRSRQSAAVDLSSLSDARPSERAGALLTVLRATIASVLRFESGDDVDPQAKLIELGLDSLAAVEFKNALESALRIALPTSLVFDYPSLPTLRDYLLSRLWPGEEAAPAEIETVAAMGEDAIDRELEALMES